MFSKTQQSTKRMLPAGFLASSVLVLTVVSGLAQTQNTVMPTPPTTPGSAAREIGTSTSSSGATWHALQNPYYKRKWGVDIVGVRLVSSGAMLRFSYRVLDPEKAAPLNDKRWNPYLVDEATGAKLGIPEMEKVGKLRQTGPAAEGRIYWMVFGNPSQLVKRGNRVDVVIGDFRAEGIVVE